MFATAMSPCYGCHRVFSYNPVAVPSITVNGVREPICQNCVNLVNPKRIANGLPPIVPLPDAYMGCDESELPG